MKKKLLVFAICILTFGFANAQLNSIAVVGGGTLQDWPKPGDIDQNQMTTSDGLTWTILNLTLLNGPVKFRANNEWNPAANWGGASFPVGTGTVDGDAMTSVAGKYNVTFNTSTLAYTFDLIPGSFQVISIIGSALDPDWKIELDMTTTDGNIYTINNVTLMPGALKLRGDHAWTLPYNWGVPASLSGKVVEDVDGTDQLFSGKYNITFNKTTLDYTITAVVLGVNDFNTITFKAYPNPTQNDWTFSSSKENIESIIIVNISGKTIKKVNPKSNQTTINASGLTNGIYFAKVTTASATQTLKLIKQ